ncbi:MAG TPA: DNA polymerase III subunit delta [Phycisphaerae bacterium]|nr:DNA polymerase III subunit delta [Phycisphaerae bacterium]HPS53880.1 DNA polymerase III subunit delta [Phycisphaerae bacterium]
MTANQTKPVYAIVGEDAFLKSQARQNIISAAIGDADPQMCVVQYDPEVELATVLDELRTMPFLAPHRVVVVCEAEAFVAANRDGLQKYLEKPSSGGTLVLMMNTLDKRLTVTKQIAAAGEVVDCNSPAGAELCKWVQDAVTAEGKKMSVAAAAMLCDMVPESVGELRNEIDKLVTYAWNRPEITEKDIAAIVTARSAPEAFAVVNAIIAADVASALKATGSAMAVRGAEFGLLGQLRWNIQRSLQAQQRISGGENQQAVFRSLRIFKDREFAAYLRRRGLQGLQGDMKKLLQADLSMKSGTEPKTAMQQLIVALCN